MVTESRVITVTPDEWAQIAEERERKAEATQRGIEAGAAGREISAHERSGIEGIVDSFFGDHVGEFDDEDAAAATRLAECLASDVLLTMFLGAQYIEGRVTDWSETPNGVLGRAIQQAADTLRPYLKGENS